jgi:hypothetical protein
MYTDAAESPQNHSEIVESRRVVYPIPLIMPALFLHAHQFRCPVLSDGRQAGRKGRNTNYRIRPFAAGPGRLVSMLIIGRRKEPLAFVDSKPKPKGWTRLQALPRVPARGLRPAGRSLATNSPLRIDIPPESGQNNRALTPL